MERKEKFVTVPGAAKPKKPPRGVYCEYWERFAHRPRRKMPARAPRPGGKRRRGCPADRYNTAKSKLRTVYLCFGFLSGEL